MNGDLVNPYGKDVTQLAVTALLRDESGKLLGGKTSFVDALPAKGMRPFSLTTGRVPGSVVQVDIVAIPWGSTGWNTLVAP